LASHQPSRPSSALRITETVAAFFFTFPSGVYERVIPPLLWAAFIFALSSVPGNQYPQVTFPFADKIVHTCLYLPLGFWLARLFHPKGNSVQPRVIAAAFATGALYGILDEFHQLFVPLRTFSLMDWATDCLAVAGGILLWILVLRRLSSRA